MNFKKALAILLVLSLFTALLTGCGLIKTDDDFETDANGNKITQTDKNGKETQKKPGGSNSNTSNGSSTLNEALNDTGIADGKFEGETTSADFTVTYISGTKNAYTYDESAKTLTFNTLSADSVYAISGKLNGNIVIDIGDSYKLDLELTDFALRSSKDNPIFANSGNEVKITAKKGTKNYIYDERTAVNSEESGVYGGSIHALVDLEIRGKGELFVQSANNNGIQTTKDLQLKNLSLVVECQDNALKGKDSVTIENCSTLLAAKSGDAIRTEASDISSTTGKQRGNVSILGGTHTLYAANDGIDASHDVIIDNGSYINDDTQKTVTVETVLNIYTDKYADVKASSTGNTNAQGTKELYICYPNQSYKFSVKLYNSDSSKSEWVDPTFHETLASNRHSYKFSVGSEYTKIQVYVYTSQQTQQTEDCYAKTDVITIKDNKNTYRYKSNNKSWEWTDYSSLTSQQPSTRPGGSMGGRPGGGMNEGNPNKLAYSAKGIKASNSITVNAGVISIKAGDDAIHADNGYDENTRKYTPLENGKNATGNLTVNGGNITVTTIDDGLHADGALLINGGNVNVLTAYEGLEGNTVTVKNGSVSVVSSDDGINSGASSGTGITISGGYVYIYANGDGIDSNSKESYNAISFTGGNTVIISTSGGNSAIDSDGGYKYSGGNVLAIMPQGGMGERESTHCQNFSSIGKKSSLSLSANSYATVKVGGSAVLSVKMPRSISALAIYLGSNSVSISSSSSSLGSEDSNGVYWA